LEFECTNNIVVTPMFPPVCRYYYCEQDNGHIYHMNVVNAMNLAKEGNVYIVLFNKKEIGA
jgi:hypothetical protein